MSDSSRSPSPPPRPPPSGPAAPQHGTSTFASEELPLALSLLPEGALDSWSLTPYELNPPGEARASLNLLEAGDEALVGVSEAGWRVHLRSFGHISRMTPEATARDDQTFDSLENLLAYLSPAFEQRRVGSLMSQLAQLAVDRQREAQAEENEAQAGSP